MFNSEREAEHSLGAMNARLYPFLQRKFPPETRFLVNPFMTRVAYNTSEFWLEQFLQVNEQIKTEEVANFFLYLSGLKLAPEWFRKKAREVMESTILARLDRDSDLKEHVKSYQSHLTDGDAVIVVAHSQGNLYRDEAFTILDGLAGHPAVARFGSVSVATPSEAASSGLFPLGEKWYTTLYSDPVIGLLPHALRPNLMNKGAGLFNHFFTESYLDGDPSGTKVLEDITCVLSQLSGVLMSPTLKEHEDGCHLEDAS